MIDKQIVTAIALNIKNNMPLWSNVSGVTRVAEYENSKGRVSRFPVAPVIQNGCERDLEKDMSPNDRQTGVLFFELLGFNSRPLEGLIEQNTMQVRLIAWYSAKCVENHTPYYVKAETLRHIPKSIAKNQLPNHLNSVAIDFVGEVVDNASIFSRYTLNQAKTQYLTPPFYYFAFDFNIRYVSNMLCASEPFNLNQCFQVVAGQNYTENTPQNAANTPEASIFVNV